MGYKHLCDRVWSNSLFFCCCVSLSVRCTETSSTCRRSSSRLTPLRPAPGRTLTCERWPSASVWVQGSTSSFPPHTSPTRKASSSSASSLKGEIPLSEWEQKGWEGWWFYLFILSYNDVWVNLSSQSKKIIFLNIFVRKYIGTSINRINKLNWIKLNKYFFFF